MEIVRYVTPGGKDVFGGWLSSLGDVRSQARILARVNRLRAGNFGDCKHLREGVFELRINFGPGYRVYYAVVGLEVVVLLCGGDKRRQSADIDHALANLRDFRRRMK